mgnify:CR=1 FL=1
MAPQPQQSPDYYAYDRRVRAEAEASTSWASAFKLFIIVAATAAFIWLIYFAFGTTGLQFALIALFVVGVAILVWFLMLKTHQQVSDTHADAVNNIVRFQHEDDAGETLRSLVVAISNGQRAGTQLDSRLLQLAGVIGEAMACVVLADALMEKLGGDSLAEMLPRFESLKRARLDDLDLGNTPTVFWP